GDTGNFELQSVGIAKPQDEMRKALGGSFKVDAMPGKPHHPVFERSLRHRESHRIDHPAAAPAAIGQSERKKGEDRAGTPGLVAKVEMIGAGIVEVHGFLDEAKAQNRSVEVEIRLRINSDRGDV